MSNIKLLKTLTARKQFLSVARGRRYAAPGLVLQAKRCPQPTQATIGIGFTATKKIGNAVVRNRAKRRLRAAVREILPTAGTKGFDYVVIGRAGTISRPWQSLLDDLTLALQMVHQPRAKKNRSKPASAGNHQGNNQERPLKGSNNP